MNKPGFGVNKKAVITLETKVMMREIQVINQFLLCIKMTNSSVGLP